MTERNGLLLYCEPSLILFSPFSFVMFLFYFVLYFLFSEMITVYISLI